MVLEAEVAKQAEALDGLKKAIETQQKDLDQFENRLELSNNFASNAAVLTITPL